MAAETKRAAQDTDKNSFLFSEILISKNKAIDNIPTAAETGLRIKTIAGAPRTIMDLAPLTAKAAGKAIPNKRQANSLGIKSCNTRLGESTNSKILINTNPAAAETRPDRVFPLKNEKTEKSAANSKKYERGDRNRKTAKTAETALPEMAQRQRIEKSIKMSLMTGFSEC